MAANFDYSVNRRTAPSELCSGQIDYVGIDIYQPAQVSNRQAVQRSHLCFPNSICRFVLLELPSGSPPERLTVLIDLSTHLFGDVKQVAVEDVWRVCPAPGGNRPGKQHRLRVLDPAAIRLG
jgi:hypothetical protein